AFCLVARRAAVALLHADGRRGAKWQSHGCRAATVTEGCPPGLSGVDVELGAAADGEILHRYSEARGSAAGAKRVSPFSGELWRGEHGRHPGIAWPRSRNTAAKADAAGCVIPLCVRIARAGGLHTS